MSCYLMARSFGVIPAGSSPAGLIARDYICDVTGDLPSGDVGVGSTCFCLADGMRYTAFAANVWTATPWFFVSGNPSAMAASFATAYQAANPAKAALVSVIVDLTSSISLGSPQTNTVELIVGPTTAVAGGTGTLTDSWTNAFTIGLLGLTLTIGGRQKLWANVPANYYFAIRRTAGTGMTIFSAFDQTMG